MCKALKQSKNRSQFISYYLIHILTLVVGTKINIEEYVKKKTLKFQIFPIKKKNVRPMKRKSRQKLETGWKIVVGSAAGRFKFGEGPWRRTCAPPRQQTEGHFLRCCEHGIPNCTPRRHGPPLGSRAARCQHALMTRVY